MSKAKLDITDIRMLELMDKLKEDGTIRFYQEFFDSIDFRKENISNIRTGHQHFTIQQIGKAADTFGVNINWIFGIEDNVYRHLKAKLAETTINSKVNSSKEKSKNSVKVKK